jgi:hypothetical protein
LADEKLTQQTETTDIALTDILYVVKAPGTVPLSRKMTAGNLAFEFMKDVYATGWTQVLDSWAYASATTITVPAGAESIYDKGDRVRLKQGAGYKYFNVVGTTDALLTITGGSDYALTTDAITDNYYSKWASPNAFPTAFNYAATVSGAGGTIGTYAESNNYAKFSVVGGPP